MSSPVTVTQLTFPACEAASGAIDPAFDLDPSKTRVTDDIPSPYGARGTIQSTANVTEVDMVLEESAADAPLPRVQAGMAMTNEDVVAVDTDPDVDAAQRAHHGMPAQAPYEGCTASAMLLRALIMFTAGVGGPWSSGLGVASAKITKGLILAAANAIEVGLEWRPKERPAAVTSACGVLDRREALGYLISDAVLGVGLISAAAARDVGQAAGKMVWVA